MAVAYDCPQDVLALICQLPRAARDERKAAVSQVQVALGEALAESNAARAAVSTIEKNMRSQLHEVRTQLTARTAERDELLKQPDSAVSKYNDREISLHAAQNKRPAALNRSESVASTTTLVSPIAPSDTPRPPALQDRAPSAVRPAESMANGLSPPDSLPRQNQWLSTPNEAFLPGNFDTGEPQQSVRSRSSIAGSDFTAQLTIAHTREGNQYRQSLQQRSPDTPHQEQRSSSSTAPPHVASVDPRPRPAKKRKAVATDTAIPTAPKRLKSTSSASFAAPPMPARRLACGSCNHHSLVCDGGAPRCGSRSARASTLRCIYHPCGEADGCDERHAIVCTRIRWRNRR